ncbi:PilZ domain-containing protein [Pseudomonas nicosulfuronedens]
MRQFLRHPCDLPVELVIRKQTFLPRQRLHNISLGGVACNSPRGFRRGTSIELRIPLLGDAARYVGVIAWSRKQTSDYRVGIAFIDEDTLFRARMIEQVCQIEHYRRQHAQTDGSESPGEDLALEWIAHNAADFPLFCAV